MVDWLDVRTNGRGARIAVRGEVDMATAPHLLDAIVAATVSEQVDEVVLDLSEVSFMDSTGIAALIEASRATRVNHVPFRVVETRPNVLRALEVAGVAEVLPLGDPAPPGLVG